MKRIIHQLLLPILSILLLDPTPQMAQQSRAPKQLAIRAARLLDVKNANLIENPVGSAAQENRLGVRLKSKFGISDVQPVIRPHAGMLRFPDVGGTQIVFSYGNNLWLVSRSGGTAVPLVNGSGRKMLPKFSPDGRTVGFMSNSAGNYELYVIPVEGGLPERVTYQPDTEVLCDWGETGKLVFYSTAFTPMDSEAEVFTVGPEGGLPEKLPVPYGTQSAVSPDGQWLAYTPTYEITPNWKRFRGGNAPDIWIFNLQNKTSKRITDWEGPDKYPMWHGKALYYVSDAGPEHRLNIWTYDTQSSTRKQITHFTDFDVRYPSIGPGPNNQGEIVFEHGSDLYLLDLATGNAHSVEVTIPGDQATVQPRVVDAMKFLADWKLSPTGKRAVLEARGDIWTVPTENGSPRNLTHTNGIAERSPAWSPNGQWIAYFSDATGEYELNITQSDGQGEARQLTRGGQIFPFNTAWSPDSNYISFTNKTGSYYVHDIVKGQTRVIDTDPVPLEWEDKPQVSWSFDSRWIAYTKRDAITSLASIWIFNVDTGKSRRVTSGRFSDLSPVFDRHGDYLYFKSIRTFKAVTSDIGAYGDRINFAHVGGETMLAVPLRANRRMAIPRSDEETWTHEEAAEKKPNKEREVTIDFEGFERRVTSLPIEPGRFGNIAINDKGALIYERLPLPGTGQANSIRLYDIADPSKKEKEVGLGADGFSMADDGTKLLIYGNKTLTILDAAAGATSRNLASDRLTLTVDPRAEWRQIFNEAWRLYRDFFYDPGMHGVNWPVMRERYSRMLADCSTREDVNAVIGEMIGELNVSHAWIQSPGDVQEFPGADFGLLGADFEIHEGAYRIAKIYQGAPWDSDARGPLSEPGLDVREGDFLLAVNGTPLGMSKSPWAHFQGLVGQVITITVSDRPRIDSSARKLVVTPIGDDSNLRYRDWIERNREQVERKTDGKVGYVYIPNFTSRRGLNDFVRQFYGQTGKEALIVDERWNGGGASPQPYVEMLSRPLLQFWGLRYGSDPRRPFFALQGPKVALINGETASSGELFANYFRKAGVGKIIGTRTWGGSVGLTGNPSFIDGGAVSLPDLAFYNLEGKWEIEGHGVDPDIEVIDDPALMMAGKDPQLDAAISYLLNELRRVRRTPVSRPPYSNRSGEPQRK